MGEGWQRCQAQGESANQRMRILIQLRNLSTQFDNAMEKVSEFFKKEKDPFFQRGVRKGIEQGIDQKNQEFVRNLITQLGLSDEQAAGVANVSADFVKEIRATIDKKQKLSFDF